MRSLLPIGAPEPEVIVAVGGIRVHGGFAVGDGAVPPLLLVINAAAEIVRVGVGRILGQDGVELKEGAVRAAKGQVGPDRVGGHRWHGPAQRGGKRENASQDERQPPQSSSYSTTLMGSPLISG